MSAHLSNEIVERFHRRAMTGGDRGAIYDHILNCGTCRQRVVTPQTEAIALEAIANHLLPQAGEKQYHPDDATIEAFVDDTLDYVDRSIVKLHLEDCAECSAEVTDLRESLATMKAASRKVEAHQKQTTESRRPLMLAPARIAAVIAFVAFAALAVFVLWRWKATSTINVPGDKTAGYQPTPAVSPQIPSFAPSPMKAGSPKVPEKPSIKGGSEPGVAAVAVLRDGAHNVSTDQAGNIVGLPNLPVNSQQAVKNALAGEPLSRPPVLDEVARAEVSVRAPNEHEEPVGILSPASIVIVEERPILRWAPSTTAAAYRVEIADESFRRVAQSDDLPASSRSWTASAPLKRGHIYVWTIRAVNKDGQPSAVTSQGKFKVLSEDKIRELNQLKVQKSHLALGLFYAREGMISEAEREFGVLVKENPESALAKKLLREVRAWR